MFIGPVVDTFGPVVDTAWPSSRHSVILPGLPCLMGPCSLASLPLPLGRLFGLQGVLRGPLCEVLFTFSGLQATFFEIW